MNMTVADGLFAQAVADEFGISQDEVNGRVVGAYTRASRNSRGMRHTVPTEAGIAATDWDATPLRSGHRAPLTDGAACLILASERWLVGHPGHTPLARVAGVGWATDSYRLDRDRLRSLASARSSWARALGQAGLNDASDLDLVELEAPTGFHEAAFSRALDLDDETLSPSGGAFAQNPLFCTGLVNATEAILQVSGRAGDVQHDGAVRAAAHSCHGYAQQGNVVAVFEGNGGASA
jgi:acetyl-CoA acetyltransferase